ncbi:MAG: META domain-containing protein [Methyloceanibacter sp.]|jgi:heat shock protein HslJ
MSLQAKVTSGTLSMSFCAYLRVVLILFLASQVIISSAAAGPLNLAGSEWGFAGETGRTARFVQVRADGVVGGSSGCNRFTGAYTQKGDELTMGPLASTRMACPPEVMEREQRFLTMFGNVRYAETDDLKLTLKDGNGEVLAELVRRDGD